MTAPFGCDACFGDDAACAWDAMRSRRVNDIVDESHFSVRITQCDLCDQFFVQVFMERIDWREGNDDQTWLVLPLSREDVEKVIVCGENQIKATLTDAGRGRRFLVRHDGKSWWRPNGFGIGPHD